MRLRLVETSRQTYLSPSVYQEGLDWSPPSPEIVESEKAPLLTGAEADVEGSEGASILTDLQAEILKLKVEELGMDFSRPESSDEVRADFVRMSHVRLGYVEDESEAGSGESEGEVCLAGGLVAAHSLHTPHTVRVQLSVVEQ